MANGVSFGTIYNILHDDLGLIKKSAWQAPKFLNEEQKQECPHMHQLHRRGPAAFHGDDGLNHHNGQDHQTKNRANSGFPRASQVT